MKFNISFPGPTTYMDIRFFYSQNISWVQSNIHVGYKPRGSFASESLSNS